MTLNVSGLTCEIQHLSCCCDRSSFCLRSGSRRFLRFWSFLLFLQPFHEKWYVLSRDQPLVESRTDSKLTCTMAPETDSSVTQRGMFPPGVEEVAILRNTTKHAPTKGRTCLPPLNFFIIEGKDSLYADIASSHTFMFLLHQFLFS